MNILVAVNEAYLPPLQVLLYSLYKHNREDLSVYILHFEIPRSRQIWFCKEMVHLCSRIECTFLRCNEGQFEGVVCSKRYRNETNLRLFLLSMLPRDMERILWLDTDILIQSNIRRFYCFPDRGQYSVVCQDMASDSMIRGLSHQLGLKSATRYFNAGVVLFYLNNMRRDLEDNVFLEWMYQHPDKLQYPDQNTLNVILQKKLIWVRPQRYNLQLLHTTERKDIKRATILHYNTKEKPWQIKYSGLGEWTYWSYALRVWGLRVFLQHWLDKYRYLTKGGNGI